MATSITQLDDQERGITVLRVEGDVMLDDARLLERVCRELKEIEPNKNITIDLADIGFLDSEGASVLNGLNKQGVGFEGVHYFVQKVIEQVERVSH
jgi:anti-anti-sigma factor